jgi:hypothetical protein
MIDRHPKLGYRIEIEEFFAKKPGRNFISPGERLHFFDISG